MTPFMLIAAMLGRVPSARETSESHERPAAEVFAHARRRCQKLMLCAAFAVAAGACGGSNNTAPSTATPSATPTPRIASTTQPARRATPTAIPLTPEGGGVSRGIVAPRPASEAGRFDCASGSAAYDDGLFSVCYPAAYPARVLGTSATADLTFYVELNGDGSAHTPNTLTFNRVGVYTRPAQCQYEAEAVDPSAQTSIADYTAGGLNGAACTARTSYAIQFKGQLRTPSGGAIGFAVNAMSDAMLQSAKGVLETIRLDPR